MVSVGHPQGAFAEPCAEQSCGGSCCERCPAAAALSRAQLEPPAQAASCQVQYRLQGTDVSEQNLLQLGWAQAES